MSNQKIEIKWLEIWWYIRGQSLIKIWSEYTLLFAFATILDPRFKNVFLKYCYKHLYGYEERKLSQVIAKLETLLQEYTKYTNLSTNIASMPSSSTISGSLEAPPHRQMFNYLTVSFFILYLIFYLLWLFSLFWLCSLSRKNISIWSFTYSGFIYVFWL